jgi:hypothetical protein
MGDRTHDPLAAIVAEVLASMPPGMEITAVEVAEEALTRATPVLRLALWALACELLRCRSET